MIPLVSKGRWSSFRLYHDVKFDNTRPTDDESFDIAIGSCSQNQLGRPRASSLPRSKETLLRLLDNLVVAAAALLCLDDRVHPVLDIVMMCCRPVVA